MSFYTTIADDMNDSDCDDGMGPTYLYPLSNRYKMYLHLPQDKDWSIDSYKVIAEFESVEEMVEIFRRLPASLIEKGMLFVMKNDILPQWEHKDNVKGGSFCYKIAKASVVSTFKQLVYIMAGNTISMDKGFVDDITGVTISPKMGDFCIIKIWTRGTKYQDPVIVKTIGSLKPVGCIFKRHTA